MTYQETWQESISWEEFISLGLTGTPNAETLRQRIGERLFIGKANAKTLFKRLNMIQINKEELIQIIEEERQ